MTARPSAADGTDAASSADPVVEAYKAGLDRTLIAENLRRTVEERIENLDRLQRFVGRFRGAAREDPGRS
jgi:hypothetical protein